MLGSNLGQWSPDGYFGIERGKNFFHLTCFENLDFNSTLLRLDDRDDVAPLDPITWFDQPFDHGTRFHIRAQAGHPELDHDCSSRPPASGLGGGHYGWHLRDRRTFEMTRVWRGHLFAAHTTDRCIELPK